jgi:hypothetical protein
MVRKMVLALLVAVAVASPALAGVRPLPATQEGNYALGQLFAQCSARVAFVAEAAHRVGLDNNAKLAQGVARGWKFAGMVILADGLAQSRQTDTEQTFDALVENKLDQLRARRELDPAASAKEMTLEFEQECEPWSDTQKKLIELMRRGN